MIKKISKLMIVSIAGALLAGCGAQSARSRCPELQGSYQIENTANLYIQRQSTGEYRAMIEVDGDSAEFLPVITVAKDKLESNGIPECSVILKGAGVLMPSDKDKTYHVSSQSQNYTSERKPNTPLVLMVMAGFQSDVYGVTRTSDALPKEILNAFSKGNTK